MDIKIYRDTKRKIRRCGDAVALTKEQAQELVWLIDDYRDFINHLLAYMTMGYSTRFKTLYDVKAEAIALQARIK